MIIVVVSYGLFGNECFFFRNIPELMLIINVLSVIVTPNILTLPIQKKLSAPERMAIDENQRKCSEEFQKEQEKFEQSKLSYEGMKYVFISLFNLFILLLALFLPKMQDSVTMGLFIGQYRTNLAERYVILTRKAKSAFVIFSSHFLRHAVFHQPKER